MGGRLLVLLLLAPCATLDCAPRATVRIEGLTMGTTYRVTVVTARPGSGDDLRRAVEHRLEEVNRHLSTWDDESEISRFNRSRSIGVEVRVSEDFLRVMTAAREIFVLSGGAWDATVSPLVELWGFGPSGPARGVPPPDRVVLALALVGFDKVEVRETGLVKRHPAVTLDLSSIAKGYGVDAVAEVVRGEGGADFLVEIGGEVYAAGARRDGSPWRVGVNRPDPDAAPDEVYRVVPLRDEALATSGGYRNFFVQEGVRRSHVIDPRTGHPVTNGIASVTVRASSCMLADGLATAVMVMGPKAGLALVERLDGVEALVVVADEDGGLRDHRSSGFPLEPPSGSH